MVDIIKQMKYFRYLTPHVQLLTGVGSGGGKVSLLNIVSQLQKVRSYVLKSILLQIIILYYY
jgi:hypothetical protein